MQNIKTYVIKYLGDSSHLKLLTTANGNETQIFESDPFHGVLGIEFFVGDENTPEDALAQFLSKSRNERFKNNELIVAVPISDQTVNQLEKNWRSEIEIAKEKTEYYRTLYLQLPNL